MKKMSWKSALVGRLVAAACATCLLLFTMSATVAHAQLLTFDKLGNVEAPVPNGYGNLQWDNFYFLNGVTYNASGYQAGVVSRNNVAYNGYGELADIWINGFFILNSAYLTAAWNDNLMVTITGYFGGRLTYSKTYRLSATHPTLIRFPGMIFDEVDFDSFGGAQHTGYDGSGTHFAMDNLSVAVAIKY